MTTATTWFRKTTDGANTWAVKATDLTAATINGTAEFPPAALLGQATVAVTATADLTVTKLIAGTGTVSVTATATLSVAQSTLPPPPPVYERLPLPAAVVPAEAQWRLITNTGVYISPLTGRTQTVSWGGERWAVTLTYRNLQRGDAAVLMAKLASMRGTYGRFELPDHAYVRRGALTYNMYVDGAGQTGSTLRAVTFTPNLANAVRAGDLFSLEDRLYMAVEDAATNVAGNATLTIVPPLTESPAHGATLEFLRPTVQFMLADNSVSWTYSPGGFCSFNAIELVEDRT